MDHDVDRQPDPATGSPVRSDTTAGAPIGRRRLLVGGGAAISLGALLAACGGGGEAGPGRVGYAPPATPLPNEEVDDAVLLRTAQSIERTILDVYGWIGDSGSLEGSAATLLARLVDDHTAAADQAGRLATGAGGEPYDCVNEWYMDRVLPPILATIEGDESQDIPPSDDPARDMLALVDALESMAASMYQGLVERLTDPARRAEVMLLGAQAARHAAAAAIAATGSPDGYVSPAVLGEEVTPDESGLVPLYAISGQFGSLAPHTLVIGAPSEAGTRSTVPLETPADNSFAYTGQTCSA